MSSIQTSWSTLADGMTRKRMGNTSCNDNILAYALCTLILFGVGGPNSDEGKDTVTQGSLHRRNGAA
jgi:hypothetical protein